MLAAANVGGTLTVSDSTGSLTQTGVLTVGGHIVLHDLGVERDDHSDLGRPMR